MGNLKEVHGKPEGGTWETLRKPSLMRKPVHQDGTSLHIRKQMIKCVWRGMWRVRRREGELACGIVHACMCMREGVLSSVEG